MADPLVQLHGKVLLITGAGQGLGSSHARLFDELGASVVATDVDRSVVERATASQNNTMSVALDVTERGSWNQVLNHIHEQYGRLDGLVNNAGVHEPAHLLETSDELYENHMKVNLYGALLGMQSVVPLMTNGGSIVNIASIAALSGHARGAAYSASKWGLRGLTRSGAKDLGEYGIRVNAICPGAVDTQMISETTRAGRGAVEGIPIPRPGRTQEISNMVAFLLSGASSYCTGQEFVVDGGMKA